MVRFSVERNAHGWSTQSLVFENIETLEDQKTSGIK